VQPPLPKHYFIVAQRLKAAAKAIHGQLMGNESHYRGLTTHSCE